MKHLHDDETRKKVKKEDTVSEFSDSINPNDKRRLILFTVITFFISWSTWFISGQLFREGSFVYDSQWLFSQVGTFAPTIAAVIFMGTKVKETRKKNAIIILLILLTFIVGFIIAKNSPNSVKDFSLFSSISVFLMTIITIFVISRNRYFYLPTIIGKSQNGIDVKWILASVFFLPILFVAAWILINIPGKDFQISVFKDGFPKGLQTLFLAFSMNFVFGGSLGEEFGWRGFALPLLLKNYNPTFASLILGLIWAFWHFPIDITSNITFGPIFFMFRLIWTLPLTIIFTWFFIKTRGNILIALILHTSVNLLSDLGFIHYEKSIILMTFLLIITAAIIGSRPEMRNKLDY